MDQPEVDDFGFGRSRQDALVHQPGPHRVALAIGHTHSPGSYGRGPKSELGESCLHQSEATGSADQRGRSRPWAPDAIGPGRRDLADQGFVHEVTVVEPFLVIRASQHDIDRLAGRIRGQVEPSAIPSVALIQDGRVSGGRRGEPVSASPWILSQAQDDAECTRSLSCYRQSFAHEVASAASNLRTRWPIPSSCLAGCTGFEEWAAALCKWYSGLARLFAWHYRYHTVDYEWQLQSWRLP